MKLRTLLAFATALALSNAGFGQTTENPKVDEQSADYVNITRVELTDDYTVVYLSFKENSKPGRIPQGIPFPFPNPNGRGGPDQKYAGSSQIWLDPETRLYKPGDINSKFRLIRAENIPTGKKREVTSGETVDFVAYFEKLPPGVEEFDFYEGRSMDGSQTWNFYGIHIKNPLKKSAAKEPKTAAKAQMPLKKPEAKPEPKVEEPAADSVSKDTAANNISKTRLALGKTISLPNVYFETSQFTLLSESSAELDELVKLMKDNPGVQIRVEGHTDNVGDFDKNLELSRKRAEAVRNYLVEKGIEAARIEAKGYGATRPIGKGGEEGRKKNRRVEFVVTQM